MNIHDSQEVSYKNGYKDACSDIMKEIGELNVIFYKSDDLNGVNISLFELAKIFKKFGSQYLSEAFVSKLSDEQRAVLNEVELSKHLL